MSEVQRYDLEYHSQFGDSYLEKALDGEWIRAEDYDEQTKRIKELEHEVGQYEWLLELAKKRIAEMKVALMKISIGYGTDEMRICAINALAGDTALDVTDRQQFAGSDSNG